MQSKNFLKLKLPQMASSAFMDLNILISWDRVKITINKVSKMCVFGGEARNNSEARFHYVL